MADIETVKMLNMPADKKVGIDGFLHDAQILMLLCYDLSTVTSTTQYPSVRTTLLLSSTGILGPCLQMLILAYSEEIKILIGLN